MSGPRASQTHRHVSMNPYPATRASRWIVTCPRCVILGLSSCRCPCWPYVGKRERVRGIGLESRPFSTPLKTSCLAPNWSKLPYHSGSAKLICSICSVFERSFCVCFFYSCSLFYPISLLHGERFDLLPQSWVKSALTTPYTSMWGQYVCWKKSGATSGWNITLDEFCAACPSGASSCLVPCETPCR